MYFGLAREGSLRSRLGTWLPAGKYAGLFDNEEDRFRLDARFCYFNTTRIMQDEAGLLAVLEYLFHRIDLAMDGEPFIIVLEEGWKLRRSAYFRARIDDWLMTVRKKNGGQDALSANEQSVAVAKLRRATKSSLSSGKREIRFVDMLSGIPRSSARSSVHLNSRTGSVGTSNESFTCLSTPGRTPADTAVSPTRACLTGSQR